MKRRTLLKTIAAFCIAPLGFIGRKKEPQLNKRGWSSGWKTFQLTLDEMRSKIKEGNSGSLFMYDSKPEDWVDLNREERYEARLIQTMLRNHKLKGLTQ